MTRAGPPDCGTWAGYRKHMRDREEADDACLAANRDRSSYYRRHGSNSDKCARGLGWPLGWTAPQDKERSHMKRIGATLASVLLPLMLASSLLSHAASAATAPRFTCGYLHVCFFQNNDYTGNVTDYTASDVSGNYGTWIEIPQGTRGSVNNNNNLNIQVYSAASQAHQTVFSNTRAVLNGWPGWWCSGPWSVCNQDLPAVFRTTAASCSPVRDHNLTLKVEFDAAFNWEHAWLTRNRCGNRMRGYADCRYPGPHGTHEDKYEAGTVVTRVAHGKRHLPESVNHCRVLSGTQVGTFWRVGYQLNYGGRWHDFWPKF